MITENGYIFDSEFYSAVNFQTGHYLFYQRDELDIQFIFHPWLNG